MALDRERRAGGEKYDILVIDAFTGDFVPTHLITKEVFLLYADMLKDDGILAMHVSNWHIDLWPTMKAAAKELELHKVGTYSPGEEDKLILTSGWVFLSRKPFTPIIPDYCWKVHWDKIRDKSLITDERGSLLSDIRFGIVPPFKEKGR